MKALICHIPAYCGRVTFIILWLFVLQSHIVGQTQMSFTGTPIVTGTAGAVNTTYRYNNVGTSGSTTIRAVIKIIDKTGGASINTIDAESGGSINAWQPVINGPNTANGSCWGITFDVSFFDNANGFPLTLASFKAHGIDIDGDGSRLREFNEPYNLASYTVENPSNLTITSVANGGVNFRSPATQYSGISLTQTNVAATWNYTNTQTFRIRIGSCCVGGTCSATGGNRQSSINFYDAVSYDVGYTVLPVDFMKMSGQSLTTGNKILWQVANESGLKEYAVEKSTNENVGFVQLATIIANNENEGSNLYEYIDANINGPAYYRIKGLDHDGRHKYSPTIRINNVFTENRFRVFNSRDEGKIRFELQSTSAAQMQMRVIDQTGRTFHVQRIGVNVGVNRFAIDRVSHIKKGIYLLQIIGRDGTSWSATFQY